MNPLENWVIDNKISVDRRLLTIPLEKTDDWQLVHFGQSAALFAAVSDCRNEPGKEIFRHHQYLTISSVTRGIATQGIMLELADFIHFARLLAKMPNLVNSSAHSFVSQPQTKPNLKHLRNFFLNQLFVRPVNLKIVDLVIPLEQGYLELSATLALALLRKLMNERKAKDSGQHISQDISQQICESFTKQLPVIFQGNFTVLNKIIGAGPGSTPTGDDLLCGALAAIDTLNFWRDYRIGKFRTSLSQEIRRRILATTCVSAHELEQANCGYFNSHFRDFYTALARGKEKSSAAITTQLKTVFTQAKAWGATSGIDSAWGYFYTLYWLIAHYLKRNRYE